MLAKELSGSTMETETEHEMPNNGQLISVAHKDTVRLLEVYVKRSLSLNDGTLGNNKSVRRQKWVTTPKKRIRRHSSDPSVHLGELPGDEEIGPFAPAESPPVVTPETRDGESEKLTKKNKKKKKPSLWKSFLGLFSRRISEDHDGEQEGPLDTAETKEETPDATATGLPTPSTDTVERRKHKKKKSKKKRLSRLSLKRQSKHDISREVNQPDITVVESLVSVEPTYFYYERVSEEMQKIVDEVKEKEEILSNEEIINRIIALTKVEGDAIDDKLKENPALNNFFQLMSYSAFKKLADDYLETETTPTINKQLTVLPTAPELVKLAFTLDFTARMASLSRQNTGHITYLGNRYLQDKFEYKQACTDHPWSDSDDAND